MKSLILSLFTGVILTAATTLHAQDAAPVDPARKAAADKLLRTLKVDQMMTSALAQMEQMQSSMIAREAKTPEAKAKAEAAIKIGMDSAREAFSWAKVGDMFVDIYAEVFTEEELKELTKFYESPIGQKFIEKQPELQAASMKRMQGLMMEIMPKIQAKVKAAAEAAESPAPAK